MIQNGEYGIRSIEKEDLLLLQKWRNNEKLRRYFREHREFSIQQKLDWYNKMINDDRFYMFMLEHKQESIGVAGLTYVDWVNRHADVHFYIGKDSRWIDDVHAPSSINIILDYGFNTINMNKLWAEIYEVDTKKLYFFQNLGFEIDAKLREHYYYNGKYHTSFILSLLKRDYEKRSNFGDSSTSG